MKVSGSLALLQMADSGTLTGEIELDGAEYTIISEKDVLAVTSKY